MSDRESDRSASSLIAASAVTLGFGVITVALRFYARRRQKAALLADDWLTLPALVSLCLHADVNSALSCNNRTDHGFNILPHLHQGQRTILL
ncbi:hypothetical protein QQS21_009997 [Conoideocrella luteorostrata]|uniref:Uncharacterized protein n=1 Tax=Conoideocrella luteorostrata TaxID=1105319 RepID=A0AAJ0CGV7_9HYPO|nr:hypothetical protein QQS21_009997 [Conoideocrella luteorostrata]